MMFRGLGEAAGGGGLRGMFRSGSGGGPGGLIGRLIGRAQAAGRLPQQPAGMVSAPQPSAPEPQPAPPPPDQGMGMAQPQGGGFAGQLQGALSEMYSDPYEAAKQARMGPRQQRMQ